MIAIALTSLVAAIHLYFTYLEMLKWESPRTRKIFGTTEEFARDTKVLAANQGLYNAFLGVGLLLGLVLGAPGGVLVTYLLLCVIAAGIYGGMTATKAAYFVQAAPAVLAVLARLAGL